MPAVKNSNSTTPPFPLPYPIPGVRSFSRLLPELFCACTSTHLTHNNFLKEFDSHGYILITSALCFFHLTVGQRWLSASPAGPAFFAHRVHGHGRACPARGSVPERYPSSSSGARDQGQRCHGRPGGGGPGRRPLPRRGRVPNLAICRNFPWRSRAGPQQVLRCGASFWF